MAITDISISEELMTNAPSIKYRGNEGPKSPQEIEMMQTSVDDPFYRPEYADDHAMEMFGKPYKDLNADELEEFMEEMRRLINKFSGGQPLPQDPTKPVNPFGPKPTGPVLPDRQMAAYGGIMGLDGRKQYGIGSWFQDVKDKIVDDLIPNEIKENPLLTTAALAGGDYFLNDGKIGKRILDFIPQGVKDMGTAAKKGVTNIFTDTVYDDDYDTTGRKVPSKFSKSIMESIGKNIVPIVGGIGAGLFTKATESDTPGLPSDDTALNLAEYKKAANLLDQKQGLAADMNFLPTVASRKYTPAEMAVTYAQAAANGGRIGFQDAGPVVDEQTTQMILDMNNRGMDVETISTITQQNANTINAILSAQNQKAEGGLMDLGGMEKDYRAEGGFVPIGREEKADDVPARLSVNEFVFTADAVRNAGGGDIDEGAKVMENMMKHLEAGGQVSEESQGMGGARDMFEVSERLSEVV